MRRKLRERDDVVFEVIYEEMTNWVENAMGKINDMINSGADKIMDVVETHCDKIEVELEKIIDEVIEEVNKLNIPVMTLKKYSYLPNSIPFPLDKMHYKYCTNSFSYMIAYAIYKGATSIDLYGVGLIKELEYREQKACIEYWLGYARGLGIKWRVRGLTTLFSTMGHAGLYGYEWCKDY